MVVRRKRIARRKPQLGGGTLQKLAAQRTRLARAVTKHRETARRATTALASAEKALTQFDDTLGSLASGQPKAKTAAKGTAKAKAPGRKRGPVPGKGPKRKTAVRARARRKPGQPTQSEALISVIKNSNGIKVSDILSSVNQKFGMAMKKTSASTQLSTLKKAGRLRNDASGWHLVESKADPEKSGA